VSLLRRWFRGPQHVSVNAGRWVVVVGETTGLDLDHDHLLAVAGVAVVFGAGDDAPHIDLDDSFEGLLHHEAPSPDKDNILLHGIGVGAQRAGAPPPALLADFERWVGTSPLVAFHAAFDQTMIGRAMKQHLGHGLHCPWLDLAPVAAGLHPALRAHALDEWLAHFGIDCAVRHQAAADTLATAELLLRLWPAARAQGCASFVGLARLARQQRWLHRGH
jgi:DNA polymerase-3 subunit epsilon